MVRGGAWKSDVGVMKCDVVWCDGDGVVVVLLLQLQLQHHFVNIMNSLRPFTMRVHEYHIVAMVGSDWWLTLHYSPTTAFNVEIDINPPPNFLLLSLLFTSQVRPGQMHFTTQNHPGNVDWVQGVKVSWHLPMGVEGETSTLQQKQRSHP